MVITQKRPFSQSNNTTNRPHGPRRPSLRASKLSIDSETPTLSPRWNRTFWGGGSPNTGESLIFQRVVSARDVDRSGQLRRITEENTIDEIYVRLFWSRNWETRNLFDLCKKSDCGSNEYNLKPWLKIESEIRLKRCFPSFPEFYTSRISIDCWSRLILLYFFHALYLYMHAYI